VEDVTKGEGGGGGGGGILIDLNPKILIGVTEVVAIDLSDSQEREEAVRRGPRMNSIHSRSS
jgi:hypothetical protein